uniref:Uncharacterized protein n=1 Tax=Palpitomonas bilix TaxID=652834 RepID=A0A7S3GLM0_9EUKA|mmetsp:Transcript_8851/g.24009  ORF Transcript_8851/g.24009 Transcript_8851/m.24009 type:complete len:830 (+) Transcript_8851:169-2658(+)
MDAGEGGGVRKEEGEDKKGESREEEKHRKMREGDEMIKKGEGGKEGGERGGTVEKEERGKEGRGEGSEGKSREEESEGGEGIKIKRSVSIRKSDKVIKRMSLQPASPSFFSNASPTSTPKLHRAVSSLGAKLAAERRGEKEESTGGRKMVTLVEGKEEGSQRDEGGGGKGGGGALSRPPPPLKKTQSAKGEGLIARIRARSRGKTGAFLSGLFDFLTDNDENSFDEVEARPDSTPYVGQAEYHKNLVRKTRAKQEEKEKKRKKSLRMQLSNHPSHVGMAVVGDIEMEVEDGEKRLSVVVEEEGGRGEKGGDTDGTGSESEGRGSRLSSSTSTSERPSSLKMSDVHIVEKAPLKERLRHTMLVYGEIIGVSLAVSLLLSLHVLYSTYVNMEYFEYTNRFSFNYSIMPVGVRVSLAFNDMMGWFLLCCWPVVMYAVCYRFKGRRPIGILVGGMFTVICIATLVFYLVMMPLSEKYHLAVNGTYTDVNTGESEELAPLPGIAFMYVFYLMIICFVISMAICAWRIKVVSMHLQSVVLFVVYWSVYLFVFIGFIMFYSTFLHVFTSSSARMLVRLLFWPIVTTFLNFVGSKMASKSKDLRYDSFVIIYLVPRLISSYLGRVIVSGIGSVGVQSATVLIMGGFELFMRVSALRRNRLVFGLIRGKKYAEKTYSRHNLGYVQRRASRIVIAMMCEYVSILSVSAFEFILVARHAHANAAGARIVFFESVSDIAISTAIQFGVESVCDVIATAVEIYQGFPIKEAWRNRPRFSLLLLGYFFLSAQIEFLYWYVNSISSESRRILDSNMTESGLLINSTQFGQSSSLTWSNGREFIV